jgi:hypothetical protein
MINGQLDLKHNYKMARVYKNTHRGVWMKHNGKIPIDEQGRSYEIHHVDSNPNNNSIDNLICVSIQEHFKIHFNQGDWGACSLILERMKISKKIREAINKKLSESRKGNNNPFYGHKLSDSHMTILKNRKGNKNPCAKSVEKVDKFTGEILDTFDTVRDAAKNAGVSPGRISACCNNMPEAKTSAGFIWRFKQN